jgi:hypothetical protein
MINPDDLPVETIELSDLQDKNGKWKYHEASEQFAMTVNMQYDRLKNSIEEKGQLRPVWIFRKRIVDGRNRCKALEELNISEVKVKKLPHKTSKDDLIELAKSEEMDRRHETPTQLACYAVREYYRMKKATTKKVTRDVILKDVPASTANYDNAKWIYKYQPVIFEQLFDGKAVILDNPHRPTQSLSAVKSFYSNKMKEDAALHAEIELQEKIDRENMNAEVEEEFNLKAIERNGKMKAYQAVDAAIIPALNTILNTNGITGDEYLKYQYAKMIERNKDK